MILFQLLLAPSDRRQLALGSRNLYAQSRKNRRRLPSNAGRTPSRFTRAYVWPHSKSLHEGTAKT
jgi:hypothetical protein